MSPRHLRYEPQVFTEPAALKDILQHLPSVRRALFINGVPKKLIAHRYRADSDVTLLRRQDDDAILRFGSSGLSDAIGVHLATANVVEEINARGFPLLFVNTSIDKFVLTAKAVIDRFPYYDQDATDGEIEVAAADLRDIIGHIDPPAMVPDRYWSTFADDVENGDMSTEEILGMGMMMAETITLTELLNRIDDIPDDHTIYIANTSQTAPATAALAQQEPANGAAPPGMRYLLEVPLAREAIKIWSEWRAGRIPSSEEKAKAVIHYAEHDAYLPP